MSASNMRPSEEEAWEKMAKSGELARFLGTEFAYQYQARLSAVAAQIEREKREAARGASTNSEEATHEQH